MKEIKHPNHMLIWVTIIVLLIFIAVVFLFLALYNQHSESYEILAIVFIFLLSSAGGVGLLGAYFTRCTKCNSWIKRYRKESNDRKIKFLCERCNILFDSGVEESSD